MLQLFAGYGEVYILAKYYQVGLKTTDEVAFHHC